MILSTNVYSTRGNRRHHIVQVRTMYMELTVSTELYTLDIHVGSIFSTQLYTLDIHMGSIFSTQLHTRTIQQMQN